jgi:hypothetical protein
VRVTLLVLVAACWREAPVSEPRPIVEREPPPASYTRYTQPPPPSRCDAVIGHLLEVFQPELAQAGFKDDVVARLEIAATSSCHETRWSDELLDCFGGVSASDAFSKCQAQMSSLQIDDLQKKMVEVMSAANQP